jgi:hypothetical protein
MFNVSNQAVHLVPRWPIACRLCRNRPDGSRRFRSLQVSSTITDHLADSIVTLGSSAERQWAQASRDADAGSLMFVIPQSHLLNLEMVSSSAVGPATAGASAV